MMNGFSRTVLDFSTRSEGLVEEKKGPSSKTQLPFIHSTNNPSRGP